MTLKEIIKDSGISKEHIVKRADMSRTRLYLAVAGKCTLTADEIKKIAQVLRISQAKLKEAQQ